MIAHVGPAAVLKLNISRSNLLRGSAETPPPYAVAYHSASSSSHRDKSSSRLMRYFIAVVVRVASDAREKPIGPSEQPDIQIPVILPFWTILRPSNRLPGPIPAIDRLSAV